MILERNQVVCADCLVAMKEMPENCIDAIVTDPPYGLSFMGKDWDHGIPGIPFWRETLRVAKPGAHMLAFGGTRTHHRLMVAIEDAGWEIRDCLMWVYGSGFPKSLDVSKAIDKAAGKEREVIGRIEPPFREGRKSPMGGFGASETDYGGGYLDDNLKTITAPTTDAAKQWDGWGTALKPAWEPIILCRKPLEGTVAENVQKWGTGAINIDACRVGVEKIKTDGTRDGTGNSLRWNKSISPNGFVGRLHLGRFPANLIHDGSDEVLALFPETGAANVRNPNGNDIYGRNALNQSITKDTTIRGFVDSGGSAARFFYTAKADTTERNKYLKGKPAKVNDGRDTPIDNPFQRGETLRKNIHPTVKPVDLLQYLCRLITPPKGLILDPFAGSGSTGIAAHNEGFDYILIEIEKEYADIARVRNAAKRLGDF